MSFGAPPWYFGLPVNSMWSPATRLLNTNGPVPIGAVLNGAVLMSATFSRMCRGITLVFCQDTMYGAKSSFSTILIVCSSGAS